MRRIQPILALLCVYLTLAPFAIAQEKQPPPRTPVIQDPNGGFLGFEVPPGARRVRLDFEPPGWIWGRRLAAAGGLVALLLGIRSASGARGGLLRPGALPRA